ncbi:hypothetical protein EOD39_4571 [Acipenser ruthenus]|uniref:Uncharacterized protein n=1 Tax=Acipenser ruthenus TaxID=7906 RepID=A0A444UHQ9_ACIRT|nr:hypothetical protein EOD39_4571 [Acipenser ruthenus]
MQTTTNYRRRLRGEEGSWGWPPLEIKEWEPIELELLLQKWKPAREAQQSPAPEKLVLSQGREEEESFPKPEEVEPWLSLEPPAAIKGEEVLSPEPEEVKSAPPPQLQPPTLEACPALVIAVPCPLLLDTLLVCLDLPALDLEPTTLLGCCQTSLVLPLFAVSLPLGDRTLLRRSPGEDLCPLLHPPVSQSSLQLPLSSRWGPVSPVRGPSLEAPH